MHDLVIRRGIVIDGTGQDRRNADVAVGLAAGSHTRTHNHQRQLFLRVTIGTFPVWLRN